MSRTVPRPRALKPVRCGTPHGPKVHRARGEYPCESCLKAASQHVTARDIESGKRTAVRVPVDVLGDLLARSSSASRRAVEDTIGRKVVEACIAKAAEASADLAVEHFAEQRGVSIQ